MGWLMDTFYRSIFAGRYTEGTYFPYFAPIYAIGGTMMTFLYAFLDFLLWQEIILCGFAFILLELVGGYFCVYILNRRLWDYSEKKWNIDGHVDIEHSIWWFVLAAAGYYLLRFIS